MCVCACGKQICVCLLYSSSHKHLSVVCQHIHATLINHSNTNGFSILICAAFTAKEAAFKQSKMLVIDISQNKHIHSIW